MGSRTDLNMFVKIKIPAPAWNRTQAIASHYTDVSRPAIYVWR